MLSLHLSFRFLQKNTPKASWNEPCCRRKTKFNNNKWISILTSFTTLATEFDKKANKLYSIFKLSKKKRKEDCAGSITTGTIYFLKCSLWCKLPFCLPCYFSATWVQPPFLYPHHCHVTLYAPDLVCLGKMGKPHSTDCMTSEKQGPVVLNFSSDNARRLVTSEGL